MKPALAPIPTLPRFRETAAIARRHRQERIARRLLGGALALSLVPLFGILIYLVWQAAPLLSWRFLVESPRDGMRAGGLWPALLGTLYLVGAALAAATPVGILAAVYLNEYARPGRFTRIVHLAVINLAGVPSIVHALFGLGAFVAFAGFGRSILAAALTLAVMSLPVIIASTTEALKSVPQSFREASWNLGATRWQTTWHIVLPNAMPGIFTGIILMVSRTAGETAPVLFTGAVFYKSIAGGDAFAYNLLDQCMALSVHLFTVSTQVPNVPDALPYAIAVVLVATVLGVNALSIALRVYLRSRKNW
jgi:phosphate transport system permease protein